ncbi:unnamed protein product, partial [Symbiodinium sp. CCMP2456]
VTKVKFWMGHFGSSTPKRHYMYSNSLQIHLLNKGKLSLARYTNNNKTAKYFVDKNNVKRFTGTKYLRGTERYPVAFANEMVRICEILKADDDVDKDELDDASPGEILALLQGVMCIKDDPYQQVEEATHRAAAESSQSQDEWKTGNKTQIARTLQDANFDRANFISRMEITIKRKNEKEVFVDEGWYSKQEMMTDLGWQNMYDKEWEYWVKVREHGKRRQAMSYEENFKKLKEGDDIPDDLGAIEKNLNNFDMDLDPVREPLSDAPPDPSAHKFAQSKETLEKFTNSVMTKIGKLRSLVKDLKTNYKNSVDAQQAVSSLETAVKAAETQYDALNELKTQVGMLGMNNELHGKVEEKMKQSTLVCSRAAATEAKIRTARRSFQKSATADEKQKPNNSGKTKSPKNDSEKPAAKKGGSGNRHCLLMCNSDFCESVQHAKMQRGSTAASHTVRGLSSDIGEGARSSAQHQSIKSIEHNSSLGKDRNLRDQLDASLRFAEIHKRCLEIQCISFNLPPMGSTAGKVLKHATTEVERLFKAQEPLIFKLGYTHNPAFRWSNAIYGYKNDRARWSNMMVLFVSPEPCGPAMLEACLIDKFVSRQGCRNVKSGGDTVQASSLDSEDRFMTYIVYRVLYSKKFHDCVSSKASATSAIRTARNVVKDVGLEKARGIGGLLPLARISQTHSEKGAHSLLSKKLGLALQIPLSETPCEQADGEPPNRFQRISMVDWARYFSKHGHWHILAGLRKPDEAREGRIWKTWWERYRLYEPSHPIFQAADANKIDLSKTIRVLLHGDEGRGRRRAAFFILSFHSILGRGTLQSLGKTDKELHSSTKKVRKSYLKMNLNFVGHSYTNRFVTAVLPRAAYGESDKHFYDALSAAYDDAKYLETVGVQNRQGDRRWLCLLKTVGDWPFLAKAGRLQRTYASSVKQVNQAESGICHRCEAGFPHAPFEQIGTRRPAWLRTVNASSPFLLGSWPPAVRLVDNTDRLAEHFAFDLFHTFHLGAGKEMYWRSYQIWKAETWSKGFSS